MLETVALPAGTAMSVRPRGLDVRRAAGRRTAAIVLVVVAAAACTKGNAEEAADPTGAHPSPGQSTHVPVPASKLSGVRVSGGPDAVDAFAAWRNRPVDKVVQFIDGTTWATVESSADLAGYGTSSYAKDMVVSLPMLPCGESGVNLSKAAKGQYDAHWRTIGQRLVDLGMADAVIRLGWEFNGGWYCWTIDPGGKAARTGAGSKNFVKAWRHAVDAMRSAPGQSFAFDWNVSAGPTSTVPTGADPTPAYPGDGYVDVVGADVYDVSYAPDRGTPQQRWGWIVHGIGDFHRGLAYWDAFARKHHKPMSFPEWGLVDGTSEGESGGGDDPYFIEQMHAWIQSHNVYYESYFNRRASDSNHFIGTDGSGQATAFPKGSKAYLRLFGRP